MTTQGEERKSAERILMEYGINLMMNANDVYNSQLLAAMEEYKEQFISLPNKQGESNEAIENESRRRCDLWVDTVAKELNEPKEKQLHIAGLLYTAFIGGAKWYRDSTVQTIEQPLTGEQAMNNEIAARVLNANKIDPLI